MLAIGHAQSVAVPQGLVFVDVAGAIDAAVHGLGVVLANRGTTAVARRDGSLALFVDNTADMRRHYYGVFRADSEHRKAIRDFLDRLEIGRASCRERVCLAV